jgi:two-component system sensor histidine kinase PhoQ
VLLLVFFGATIAVLDAAFVAAGEAAREEILDGYLMQMLAEAEPSGDNALRLPVDLVEARFNTIGSGLYAELQGDDDGVAWQSRSALGLTLPASDAPPAGEHRFSRERLQDSTPLLALSLAVQWEFADGSLRPYVFRVFESLDAFNAQVSDYRRNLFRWFGGVAIIMLLAIGLLLRSLLKPLRKIEAEISEIEEGGRLSLSERYPTELSGVASNMNLLIDSERARSNRYRYTLDNLAHSLKTPLAAVRSLLNDADDPRVGGKINEQVERMDEIVRYQLRKPAASPESLVLKPVAVAHEIARLTDGMSKVYRDKAPHIETEVADGMHFRGDTGDFLELAGNLIDNACKWCKSQVRVAVKPAVDKPGGAASGMILSVEDDGPGIPADAADALLLRGTRLDESAPGHGIGLAIVADLARSYGGELKIGDSSLGGAAIIVTIPPVSAARSR